MLKVVVALVLLVSGCATVGGEATPVAGSGPVTARVEVHLRPVVEVLPTGQAQPPDVLQHPDGGVYRLGPVIGDLTRFDDVRAELLEHGWVVSITLGAEDSAEFAAWTAEHIGEQLAIVVDGRLVTAPTIQGAITGGVVQVSGNFTRDDAEGLVEAITG